MRWIALPILVAAFAVASQVADPPLASPAKVNLPAPEVAAFLAARAVDIGAGSREPFKSTLLKLATSTDPTEHLWALTRLLEAGDLEHYPACSQAMLRHVQGTVQARPNRVDYRFQPAHQVLGKGAPEATIIAPASRFWRVLGSTLDKDAEARVDESMYAVWCFNTQASQRDLIRRVASRICSSSSPRNPGPEPWNDPRFWIVVDWAIVWGGTEDFNQLQQIIPDPRAKQEFRRRFDEIRRVQAYLPCLLQNSPALLEAPGETPSPAMEQARQVTKLLAAVPPLAREFSEVKIRSRSFTPSYPIEARSRRLKGDLAVEITVDTHGSPCMVRMKPGPFLAFFAPTCLQYAEGWRFDPATHNGVPVASRFLLTMPFRLR